MRIVVIEALGLHLGYLGCYGNDWVATPNLDRLAAEGVAFDWHYADQPELLAETPWARRSVGTGRYGSLGIGPESARGTVARVLRCERIEQLPGLALQAVHENENWVWIEGPSLLPPWNLDDELLQVYFDEDDQEEGLEPWKDPPTGVVELTEAERLELQNTYGAVVTCFDAHLGVLIDSMRAKGLLDDVLMCVTARSGLPLGEHGMIGAPRPSVHDEFVHLPLVMRLPGASEGGMRVRGLTQPADLFPTFLELLAPGRPVPMMHGQNLLPLVRGAREAVRPYAVAESGAGAMRLLRTGDWALHVPADVRDGEGTVRRLYAKPEDRWEVNDLYQQQTELAEEMEKTLRAFEAVVHGGGPLPAIIS